MRDQQTSIKGKLVSILASVGQTVSVATIQLCRCSTKVASDNTETTGHLSTFHTFVDLYASHHPRANPIGSVSKVDLKSLFFAISLP